MAVVAVAADNTRIAVATIATDTGTWGNDGGGGGVADEPDIVYQGSTAQSRKVSTTVIGRNYTHGSGTDMDGTPANRAHYIAKVNATNSAALLTRTSPALHMKVGSGSGAYHTYYLFGSDNYPPRGGWQIIAIAPSVPGYAAEAGDTGSPNDASVLYWSVLGDFSSTAKAENLCIDAIDVGLGLFLTGGDGGDTDGVFQDFVDHDQGTSGNRYGYVFTQGPVLFVTGQLAIGRNTTPTAVATAFTDSGVTVVWQNGLVTSGFNRFLLDLGGTGTVIAISNCALISEGELANTASRSYVTAEDSRTIFEITGTTGAATLTACVFDNFSTFLLNNKVTLRDCTITNSGKIDAGAGADLGGTSVSGFEDVPLVDAQDETSYDNSPTTEGTFAGGTGYAATDTITLQDGTVVTVDAVSGGVVTQFTIDATNSKGVVAGTTLNQADTSAAGSGFTLTPDTDNIGEAAALEWDVNLDPDGELDDMSFTKGTAAAHAIEFGITSPLTMTLRGWTTSGYNASNGNPDSTFWVRRTSGTVTINVVGGGGNFSYKSDGATVNVVVDPVTTLIHVDDNTGAALQNARVLVQADDATGIFPFRENVSITRSGATATVSHTGHGMITGDYVVIEGSLEAEYRGVHLITFIDANSYSYTVSGTPTTPATPRRIATGQDETSYDNSPTSEGTFSGGTGHAVNDVLTLEAGYLVTVDAVSAGVVTQFTVDGSAALNTRFSAGDTVNQVSSDGAGTGFSLTLDTDNLTISATGAFLHGLTDVNGDISRSRVVSTDTPIKGFVRKSTASPRFKSFDLDGNTVDNVNGLSVNVRLILDE